MFTKKKVIKQLDAALENVQCDNTLRCTREFFEARGIDFKKGLRLIGAEDLCCDCEILVNICRPEPWLAASWK